MSMITTLTALVAVLMLVIPLAAEAQPQAQVARIGVLSSGSPATSVASLDAFRQRLRELGYAEGRNVTIESRYAATQPGRIGTVTNLAARLCGEAKGGQILVSSRVAGAVEELIDGDEVGTRALKGFLKPVPTFNVGRLKLQ